MQKCFIVRLLLACSAISVELRSEPLFFVPVCYVQLAESNVLFYSTGCVAYKLWLKVCQGKFTRELSGAQHEQFLTSKQYASLECTLTVPSTQLFHVTDLEKTFTDNMERIMYMDKVVGKLIIQFESKMKHLSANMTVI